MSKNQVKLVLFLAGIASVVLLAAFRPLAPETPATNNGPCVSGQCMPIGNLPAWKQIFTDDFAVPVPRGRWTGCVSKPFVCTALPAAYRAKWWAYPTGWKDTSKHGVYTPGKVLSIANGVLDIYLHTENGVHLVSAPVPLIHGNNGPIGQRYGRYVIRFRAPSLVGYKIAWLLWPDSEVTPRDGEIDFPEGRLNGKIGAYMHHQGATSGADHDAFPSSVLVSSGWHTATIEWRPAFVRFILDGKLLGTSTKRIPNTPMHWVIQTETDNNGLIPANATAGHLQIDWVTVYAPSP